VPTCSNCAKESPESFQFCPYCGAPLQSQPAAREVRKIVTVVFCDVTGSTALGERLDPESLARVMHRYFNEMQRAVERHGGTVEKFIGDAVMAVFGVPQLHEDDALRAVRAAADMRNALFSLNEELRREHGFAIRTRIGVNTGQVLVGNLSPEKGLVTGDAVNVAARLEQAARPGEVLIGEATYRLAKDALEVESLDPLPLKGKRERVRAYRLLRVIAGPISHAPRLSSPMVGRRRELALLRQSFGRVVSDRACHLFTVLGSAGVGKSRLVEEFLERLEDQATVLRGRCLPYGEGITYWPVVEVVKQATGLLDFDPPREVERKLDSVLKNDEGASLISGGVAQILGVTEGVAVPEETPWAIRRFLEALSRRRPLVVVFDDIHWGERTFLDLIEHIADWSRDAAILLVCMARPELFDSRPGWAGGKLNAASITLEPLTEKECDLLIDNLLGRTELVENVRARVAEAAEGNPLFVEQMLSMLIDDGLVRREDGRWVATGDLSRVSVPPNVFALLSARLDRLEPEERAVLERASVVGKVFYRGAVRELSSEQSRTRVDSHLMSLIREEVIAPTPQPCRGTTPSVSVTS